MALCLVVLLFGAWVATKKGKLEVPHYVIVVACFYIPFLILGLIHEYPNPTIDIKFQFYGLIFYLFLVNVKDLKILRVLFILNAVVAIVYILSYLGFVPSLWNIDTTGKGGRVYGPAIIPIVLIGFYYLYNRMSFDLPLAVSWVIALIYLFLTSNLMNLVTAGVLLLLIVINVSKIFKPVFILGFSLMIVVSIAFFNSKYAPEAIKEKLPYVLKPWEYDSLKIRIQDLNTALLTENFTWSEKLIGKGFGVTTTVYRENKIAQFFSGKFTFLEIDNGFYYVYHRGGFLLLFIFLIAHIYLVFKIPSMKAKLGFIALVLFTNLLSIHYFTNMFYLIVPFLILETEIRSKKQLSKSISNEE
ncbi:hypothetical protein AEQU1_00497 [Aequorivita sp. CIP111184]|nr:hypothetical protein AEQU1_00497 [Aequorivita sp. CIP111184]